MVAEPVTAAEPLTVAEPLIAAEPLTAAEPVTVLDALEHMLTRARSHSSTFEAILNETKTMGQLIP